MQFIIRKYKELAFVGEEKREMVESTLSGAGEVSLSDNNSSSSSTASRSSRSSTSDTFSAESATLRASDPSYATTTTPQTLSHSKSFPAFLEMFTSLSHSTDEVVKVTKNPIYGTKSDQMTRSALFARPTSPMDHKTRPTTTTTTTTTNVSETLSRSKSLSPGLFRSAVTPPPDLKTVRNPIFGANIIINNPKRGK